jgi:hypothetical protein
MEKNVSVQVTGRNTATYRLLIGAATPGLQVEDTTYMEHSQQVAIAVTENCSAPRAHHALLAFWGMFLWILEYNFMPYQVQGNYFHIHMDFVILYGSME